MGSGIGTGGIIVLVIVGFWVVYLVPVLVRERAARLENREADRSSAAVRVLQRPPAQRPSHRVVLTGDRPLVSDRLPARPTRDLAETLQRSAARDRRAVRLRAGAALLGLLGLVVTVGAAPFGLLPWWSVAVAGGWLTAVVASGAVAAGTRRRTRTPVRRSGADLPPRARRVATEVFDARASRTEAASAVPTDGPAVTQVRLADLRRELAASAAAAGTGARSAEAHDGTWTPTEVPAPVYASKPVSSRAPTLPWSLPPVALGDAEPVISAGAAAGAAGAPAAAEAAGPAPAADSGETPERRSAAG